jgi:hypothetical protein
VERAGRRAGRLRRPSETVTEYGTALDGGWPDVARAVDESTYGGYQLQSHEWTTLVSGAEGRSRRKR